MALVQYSRYLFYPGGGLATGEQVRVTLFGSNVVPSLFADAAGTTPAADPLGTDAEGLLSFYAPPGLYSVSFAGEDFLVQVDPAETAQAVPGIYVHEQVSPASTWTIAHHFGIEPRVDVLINNTSTAAEAISHPDKQTTVVTFVSPVAGTAHLRR